MAFVRQGNPYYDTSDNEGDIGIENTHGAEMYGYSDKPRTPSVGDPMRTNSASSFRTESAGFLKEMDAYMASSPNGDAQRKGTPLMATKKASKSKTQVIQGVPQTDV